MTNTTKFILLGAAAFVGVLVVAKKLAPKPTEPSKPSALGSLAGLVSGLRTVSYPKTAAPPAEAQGAAVAYSVGGIDGLAGVSDATGLRSRHPVVPAQALYPTDAERLVSGDYS